MHQHAVIKHSASTQKTYGASRTGALVVRVCTYRMFEHYRDTWPPLEVPGWRVYQAR